MVWTLRQPTDREVGARCVRVGVSLGVAFIDLQLDCGDVNFYFCKKTHKCVAKKNEHTICVGECVWCVFVCVYERLSEA